MPRSEAVISRYEEDVQWVRSLPMPAVIYNKGKTLTGLEADFQVIPRPNVGREAETFLNYIVDRYDTLPDYVAFLQGDPFAHCKNVLHTLAGNPDPGRVIPLSTNWKRERVGNYNWQGFEECILDLEKILEIPTIFLGYSTGAQYLVPQERILSRPKSTYENLLAKLNTSTHPFEAWGMERLWNYVFGWKDKTEKTAFDVIVLPSSENADLDARASREAALRYGESQNSGIQFSEIIISEEEDAWWDAVLKKTQDFVCFVRPDQKVSETAFVELAAAYRHIKHEYLKEDDLCLALGDDLQLYFPQNVHPVRIVRSEERHWRELVTPTTSFLTHWSVLSQHRDLFGSPARFPDSQTLMLERGIPAFSPMPSLTP